MMISEKLSNTILGIVILMSVLFAYLPALEGDFIWDDDLYVTENNNLKDFEGLKNIWFKIRTSPQYYPLVFTSFWIEYRIWDLKPFGYHLTNIILHILSVLLLWKILTSLNIKGAWLTAAIFALHPVNVESVAWITERKNVLSGFFYMASLLLYIRFFDFESLTDKKQTYSSGKPVLYFSSLGLFLCALLSKTVTASMPAVICLIIWWKKGKLRFKDIYYLLPLFFAGAFMGALTAWREKHHIGVVVDKWALPLADKLIVAGRALWFYAYKLLYPFELTFIYPRWKIDSNFWSQYLFTIGAIAIISVLLFYQKRIGRGAATSILIFAGTLFPALGFIDLFPLRFSFVADHFQYLASIGLILLFVAATQKIFKVDDLMLKDNFNYNSPYFLRSIFYLLFAGSILLSLTVLTWKQAHIYKNLELLWTDTLSKNPSAWIAHNNLGVIMADKGKFKEATYHYKEALKFNKDYFMALNNLGLILKQEGKFKEAITHFRKAVMVKENYEEGYHNLANALNETGKFREAEIYYKKSLQLRPGNASTYNDYGTLFGSQKKYPQAINYFQKALTIDPDMKIAYKNLTEAIKKYGDVTDLEIAK